LGFLAGAAQSPAAQISPDPQVSLVVWQTPAALQVLVLRTLFGPQPAGPQVVPAFSRWQPPLPSQPLEQASSRQIPAGSAPPVGTGLQVPSLPARSQAWQLPLQAELQQRPWAQKPVAQSPSALQRAPRCRLPQLPATHTLPGVHWASLPQMARHRLPPQPAKGPHERAAGASQVPAAQVAAGVSALAGASQLAARHTVPSA
jgi:hypothetical protein